MQFGLTFGSDNASYKLTVPTGKFLLLEDNSPLLLEDGSKLILEGDLYV